jgi:hypothetical protein
MAASGPARPAAPVQAAVDKPDNPTVRPFRPAAAAGTPVNAARPLPPVSSLADLMGGLGITGAEPISSAPRTPEFAAGPGAGGNTDTARPPGPARSAADAYDRHRAPTGPESRARHTNPVVDNLISVGMPEQMAAQITGGDTYAGVLTVLASRPAAPAIPDAPGEILVLAGDLDPARAHLVGHVGDHRGTAHDHGGQR